MPSALLPASLPLTLGDAVSAPQARTYGTGIDFWLCDLQGRSIGDFMAPAQASVALALNAGRRASVSVSFDDPAAAKVRALSTVLKASWDRGHLFSGVVTRPQFQGRARRVVVPAQDPSLKLAVSYFAGTGSAWPTQTGVDQSLIMARIMENAQPTFFERSAGVPPTGVLRGGLAADSIARDREYPDGKSRWEAMVELSAVLDGVDFDLRAVDQQDGTLALLDTYWPMMGADKSETVIFEYGWGLENVVDCQIEEAGDLVKNVSARVGQRDNGTGITPYGNAERTESEVAFGVYGDYVAESGEVSAATLQERADGIVAAYAFPPFFVTMTPAQDDGSGYRVDSDGILTLLPKRYGSPPVLGPNADYWLGDVVTVVVRDGPAFDFELQVRVVQVTLTNASNGAVVAELTLAPVLGGGYRVPGVLKPSFAREFGDMRERLRLSGVVQ